MRLTRQRLGAAAMIAVTLAALVSPLVTGRDSFPLSTYPMYAAARADTADLVSAVGVTSDGGTERLSLGIIGNSDDPLIVESLIRTAIANGTTDSLCRSIASRAPAQAAKIEVVTERHDLRAIARDPNTQPIERTVHTSCAVEP